MNFDIENIRKHLPFYLTASDQKKLVDELKKFADGNSPNYYLSAFDDSFKEIMLQGDGWRGFELFIFKSGERRTVRGIVLSNSCDVDRNNNRELPTQIVFTPLVKLSTYQSLLKQSGVDERKINAKILSIKAQKTTNMFFLPACKLLEEDYVARLDDLHSMPTTAHKKCEKLFTLSMLGFYLFVLKLSVHFCRLQENVNRNPAIVG